MRTFSRRLPWRTVAATTAALLSFAFPVGPAQADSSEGSTSALQTTEGLITVGGLHVCAIETGAVQCWGNNDSGQLGNNGTAEIFATAVTVLDLP